MVDEDTSEELTFACHRWLCRDQEDGDTCREMAVVRDGQPMLPTVKYEVAVKTGDLWNGGTDGNVYVTMHGEKGDSGVRQLYRSNKPDKFTMAEVTTQTTGDGFTNARMVAMYDNRLCSFHWLLLQYPNFNGNKTVHC